MSFVPAVEEISNSTLWIEATAVYFATNQAFQLTESAGGGTVTGSFPAGSYSKSTFATAFKAALETASFNDFIYTVSSDQVNYLQMPNLTPTKYGGSWTITFNGTGYFNINWP